MKKTSLLTILLVSSLFARSQDCPEVCKKSPIKEGRTWYGSLSIGSSTPPRPTFSYSGEFGLWGTTKPTTIGLTFDACRPEGENKISYWAGIKGYLSLFGSDKAVFMVYASPKVNLDLFKPGLLELGINPCFNINKHLLFSFSVCNQIMQKSEWNFGGSIGFVYLR